MKRDPSLTILTTAACLLLALLAGCPSGGASQDDTSPVASMIVEGIQGGTGVAATPPNEESLKIRLLDLINHERTGRGLAAVQLNFQLNAMAAEYCTRMIELDFFGHEDAETGQGPGYRAIAAGYVYLAVGENLAAGQPSPEQVMAEWMNSTQGHRENILASQWREAGIAIRTGGKYGVYWVLEFGNPP